MIDNLTMAEAVDRIRDMIKQKNKHYVVTPNVDHIVKLQEDPAFQNIYKKAGLVLADGKPLLWAARYLGSPLKEKISGSDIFPQICGMAEKEKLSVFFMGGRPGAAERAKDRILEDFPSLDIRGVYCPPYGFEKDPEENRKAVEAVNKVCPDILFVGLGAPKQEKWIYNNLPKLNVSSAAGIGVTLEFLAGMVKRAPSWMQRWGLEWFWRVLMEPRRLWKRYFIDDMKFFPLVFRFKRGESQRVVSSLGDKV